MKISRVDEIKSKLSEINKVKGPLFIEVITTNRQKIVDSFGYQT